MQHDSIAATITTAVAGLRHDNPIPEEWISTRSFAGYSGPRIRIVITLPTVDGNQLIVTEREVTAVIERTTADGRPLDKITVDFPRAAVLQGLLQIFVTEAVYS